MKIEKRWYIRFFLMFVGGIGLLLIWFTQSQIENLSATNIDLVYDIYVEKEKIGTIENFDILKEHIQKNIEGKYGVNQSIYFGESININSRYKEKNEEINVNNEEAIHQQLIDTEDFDVDAVVIKVKENDSLEKTFIVNNNKIWSEAIDKVKNVAAVKLGKEKENFSISLEGQVEYTPIRTKVSKILTEQKIIEDIVAPSQLNYKVIQGQTIEDIAENTASLAEELKLLNPKIKEETLLLTGAELILPDKMYEIEFSKIEVEIKEEPLLYEIQYIDNDDQYVGKTSVLAKGQEGKQKVQYLFKYGNEGEKIYLSQQQLNIIQPSVPEIIERGTKEAQHIGTGEFLWPSPSKRTAAEFMDPTYGYGDHYALDINDRLNGEIYAADNGTVVQAGYSESYGNHVIINHNNGFWTLYAHMNTLNVRSGEVVEKGRVIGGMGTTGFSTGVHLHFELRVGKNDKYAAVNPRMYIS